MEHTMRLIVQDIKDNWQAQCPTCDPDMIGSMIGILSKLDQLAVIRGDWDWAGDCDYVEVRMFSKDEDKRLILILDRMSVNGVLTYIALHKRDESMEYCEVQSFNSASLGDISSAICWLNAS